MHHHNELAAHRGGKIDATIPSNINSNKMLFKKHAKNGEQSFEGGFTVAFSFMHIYNGELYYKIFSGSIFFFLGQPLSICCPNCTKHNSPS